MHLRQAIEVENYVAFFQGIARTLEQTGFKYKHFGYLLCALAHEYFPRMRTRALEIMTNVRGSKNAFAESLAGLCGLLGLDDAAHCEEFLAAKDITSENGMCLLVKGLPIVETLELCDVRKIKMISAKMPPIPGDICGTAATVSGLEGASGVRSQQRREAAKMAGAKAMQAQAKAAMAAYEEARKKAEEKAKMAAEEQKRKADIARQEAAAKEEARKVTKFQEMLAEARKECASGSWELARRKVAEARKVGAGSQSEADKVDSEIMEQEKAEAARKAKEAQEQAARRAAVERERHEKAEKARVLLERAKSLLEACTIDLETDSALRLKAESKELQTQIQSAQAIVLEARTLLFEPISELESGMLKRVEGLLEAGRDKVKNADVCIKKLELEAKYSKLLAQHEQQVAEAEACQGKCKTADGLLMQQQALLVARTLEPSALMVVNMEYAEELAREMKRRWEASEELHVLLRSHIGAAEMVLAEVGALDEIVSVRGKTAVITNSMTALRDVQQKQQAMLLDSKQQYDAAVAALVGERARRLSEAEALMQAKIERYKKRKQHPLQPCNEAAMAGWGVGVFVKGAGQGDGLEQQAKRQKENRDQMSRGSGKSGVMLMDETVRRIVMTWSERQWSGMQLQQSSAALRRVATGGVPQMQLLHTVSPTLAIPLQICVTVSAPARGSGESSPEGAGLGIGGTICAATARFLHVPKRTITMLCEVRENHDAGGQERRVTVSLVLQLHCSSPEALVKAAMALRGGGGDGMASGAVATLLGVSGSGCLIGEGESRQDARNGLQEAVRLHCLRQLRGRRGGGSGGRGSGVPLVRSVSCMLPAALHVKVGVYAATCEDSAGEGEGWYVVGARQSRGLTSMTDTRKGRQLLQKAILKWLRCRLGLQAELPAPYAFPNVDEGRANKTQWCAIACGRVSLSQRDGSREGIDVIGEAVGEGGQKVSEKLVWNISSIESKSSHIDFDKERSNDMRQVTDGSIPVSLKVVECQEGLRQEHDRRSGVVLLLPPLVFTEKVGTGRGREAIERLWHRTEGELAKSIKEVGWTYEEERSDRRQRLVVIVAVVGSALEALGGRDAVTQRLCKCAFVQGGGTNLADAGQQMVHAMVLEEEDVMESMALSSTTLLSAATKAANPDADRPYPSTTAEAVKWEQGVPASVSSHYLELFRVWGSNQCPTSGLAPVLTNTSIESDRNFDTGTDVRGLEGMMAWVAGTGWTAPVVSEYDAASLLETLWRHACRAMPTTASIESASLVGIYCVHTESQPCT
jgi:hypothetical protein